MTIQWVRLGVDIGVELRKVPTFATTPFGVLANILTLSINDKLFGVLLWGNKNIHPLVLQLKRCLSAHDAPGDVYHPVERRRLLALDVTDAHVHILWKSLYLSSHTNTEQTHAGPILPQVSLASPFHVSPIHLLDDVKWEWSNLTLSEVHHPWHGDPPLKISFWSGDIKPYLHFVLHLGCCAAEPPSDGLSKTRWAFVDSGDYDKGSSVAHDCPGHHISTWSNLTRVFHGVYRFFEWGGFWDDVELSFIESSLPIPSGRAIPLQPQVKIISVSPNPFAVGQATRSSESSLSQASGLFSTAGSMNSESSAYPGPLTPQCPPVHPLVTHRHRSNAHPSQSRNYSSSLHHHRNELFDNLKVEKRVHNRMPLRANANQSLSDALSFGEPSTTSSTLYDAHDSTGFPKVQPLRLSPSKADREADRGDTPDADGSALSTI